MRIFIFATSFSAKMYGYMLGYTLCIEEISIVLLKENHDIDEFSKKLYDNVILCTDVDECIRLADTVLVLQDGYLPKKVVEYVISKCESQGKRCLELNNTHETQENVLSSLCDIDKCSEWIRSVPTVLIIGCGYSSQQYCTEILLNKILTDEKINFKQYYSKPTYSFLSQMESYNNLNKSLVQDRKNKDDLCVIAMDIGEKLDDITKYTSHIQNLRPDFVILQTDCNFNEYEKAGNILRYCTQTPIDVIIRSPYIKVGHYDVYVNDKTTDETFLYCGIMDEIIEQRLKFLLMSKLSLPDEIFDLM